MEDHSLIYVNLGVIDVKQFEIHLYNVMKRENGRNIDSCGFQSIALCNEFGKLQCNRHLIMYALKSCHGGVTPRQPSKVCNSVRCC